ncbi:EAL domain-containing protein [Aquabacterium sp.]|uniref:bifunctional diguanylate cyclase/phosphodiesterase n=1 Tax=Aquabacterium sp. TaxID=1872578 RepID=UPI0035B2AC60
MSDSLALTPNHTRRSLALRIVVVFLGLLLAVQAMSFALIRHSIDDSARANQNETLDHGEQVFLRLLRQNADHLVESTRLLAADYGFRSATARGDRAALASTLAEHGERLGAGLAVVVDTHLRLKAGTEDAAIDALPLLHTLVPPNPNLDSPVTTRIVQVAEQPYQVAVVPVKAPFVIGWVVMGLKLDERLLNDMRQLTGMDVAILTRSGNGSWRVTLTALRADQIRALSQQWSAAPAAASAHSDSPTLFKLPSGDYIGRVVSIESRGAEQSVAVLLRPVDDAGASYQRLQLGVLILTVFSVLVFAIGSMLTARRITTPITTLTKLARKLAGGDYDAPVPSHGSDEIGELADAFETMRQAVREREDEIRRQGFIDALTQLPNRAQFNADLRKWTSHVDQTRQSVAPESNATTGEPAQCAVLMLDLDRFKHVNDVLGHETGDQLLKQVATLLRNLVTDPDDTVARLGGDEFAVLLHASDLSAAQELARRIQTALEKPLLLGDQTVDVGTGIGIALYPEHAADAMTLKRRAEMALYKAKQTQTGTVVFNPDLDVRAKEALTLLGELRQAIEQDQLRLYLQPKVSLATGEVTGAEALVRWQHPQRGLVPPMQFIPFAEQTGFIRNITAWLLEASARTWRQWAEQGLRLQLSLNLSARDLIDHELPDKLSAILEKHGVPPHRLYIEITESSIMDDPQRALQTLDRFHKMGLMLAIDDFGTGYSSLAYLKRLPVDELKIDKTFVMNMQRDEQDAKIVRSTIDLAHNLGLKVVAEGLEDEQAWPLLKALSCDQAQGYWIARPMPASDFPSWLDDWVRPRVDHTFLPLDAAVV